MATTPFPISAADLGQAGRRSRPAPPAPSLHGSRLGRAALAELAPIFREVIVLREIEALSYREIAGLTGVPLGTVMSRLARARAELRQILARMTRRGESDAV